MFLGSQQEVILNSDIFLCELQVQSALIHVSLP